MLLSRREFLSCLLAVGSAATAIAANFNGVDYISMPQLAALCGMRYTRLSGKKQSVYSKYSRFDFELHSRAMTLNGTTVWLCFPIVGKGSSIFIAKRDYV